MLLAIDVYSNHYRLNGVLLVVYYARREPVCCLNDDRLWKRSESSKESNFCNDLDKMWIGEMSMLSNRFEINRLKSPFNRIQCECACETWFNVNRNMWQALQVLRPIQLLLTFGSFDWSMKRCRFFGGQIFTNHIDRRMIEKKYLWKFFLLKTRSRTVWSSRIGRWRSSCDLFLDRLEQAPHIKVNSFESNLNTLTHAVCIIVAMRIHQFTRNPRHKRDCF